MNHKAWDATILPVYGCLTGIELPTDHTEILPGIGLRQVYVDTFGTTMLAFKAPRTEKSHHPGPWIPVRGGFTFESRVEVGLTDTSACNGLRPTLLMWLVAAILRLRVLTPLRLAVLGNMPFDKMGESQEEVHAIAFESASLQIGTFTASRIEIGEDEFSWMRDMLPVAARLYDDERFSRSFSIYNQAQWASTVEMGTTLIWTAMEILFDLSGEREKTKAVRKALSDYVAADRHDRDRAYPIIHDLYYRRGQMVHAGRSITQEDVFQSFRFASVAFQRVLIDGGLPPSRQKTAP